MMRVDMLPVPVDCNCSGSGNILTRQSFNPQCPYVHALWQRSAFFCTVPGIIKIPGIKNYSALPVGYYKMIVYGDEGKNGTEEIIFGISVGCEKIWNRNGFTDFIT